MIGWCNGEWAPLPAGAEVSTIHPGLSLFETFAFRQQQIACLPDHLARLQGALPRLGLAAERFILATAATPAAWSAPVHGLLARNGLTEAVLRLMVYARPDGRPLEWLTARPLLPTPATLELFRLQTIRDQPEWLPRPKSGPWANSSAAWRELRTLVDRPDVEGIQFDATGQLAEGTRSSLAWWDGAAWAFPASETGRLPGTAAAQLRGILLAQGKRVTEVAGPFPSTALSIVVLRSTFAGGAVLANAYTESGQVLWRPAADQSEAQQALRHLAAWRAQRCISLA